MTITVVDKLPPEGGEGIFLIRDGEDYNEFVWCYDHWEWTDRHHFKTLEECILDCKDMIRCFGYVNFRG